MEKDSMEKESVEKESVENYAEDRGVTLNTLRDEQHCLNMRMLLAVQVHDLTAQEALRQELEENAARIEHMLSRL